MITSLRIKNYALIESLNISFSAGFSVITGETGAGKSIILGALGLLLGQRADAKAIKAGATKCVVEATFSVERLPVHDFFTENDIDYDATECILRREVTAAGKSRAFINDTPVSLTKLKELVPQLIDIHSQHQNLLLGQEHFLLNTLDALAHNEKERTDYLSAFRTWNTAKRELDKLRQQSVKDKADTDYLRFQLTQLEEARLKAGEQAELEAEQDLLSHAEDIKSVLYEASSYLSNEDSAPADELKALGRSLSNIEKVFPPASELSERLHSLSIELSDIADELENALDEVDFDPKRLAFVEERLDTIYSLERKHGVESVEELLQLIDQFAEQLDQIENIDTHISKQEKLVAQLWDALTQAGKTLTATRQKAGHKLATELKQRLQHLGMPSVAIEIDLSPREAPEIAGMDMARLLFSANKNVPLREVAEIASGGEIARLMLSLKTILAGSKQLPTIVFDEIDTGVSGTMAEKMAILMDEMSATCQVLCITHLPQIAARGTAHYRVFKQEDAQGTTTGIAQLSNEERIHEIANMLSGEELTDAAINNAKALLKFA